MRVLEYAWAWAPGLGRLPARTYSENGLVNSEILHEGTWCAAHLFGVHGGDIAVAACVGYRMTDEQVAALPRSARRIAP